ncbi:MAG: helicase [Planctomycetaceae bacterium]|nr:MAG: helicase [Planctomycetaceae bacterium]
MHWRRAFDVHSRLLTAAWVAFPMAVLSRSPHRNRLIAATPLSARISRPGASGEPVRSRPEPLLIRASAGTGKTYQLTGRLMRLLADGAAIESILATTFTRKAAGEILSRVLLALSEAAVDDSGKKLNELRDQVGGDALSRPTAERLVHALVRDIHRLRILTLDSLFSQFARTFDYELGLPPGWRLTDPVEDAWIRERAIDDMLGGLEGSTVTALLAMLGKGDTKRSVRREMLAVVNDGYAEARACPPEAWQKLDVPSGPEPERLAEAAERLRSTRMGHKSADGQLVKLAESVESGEWEAASVHKLVADVHCAGPAAELLYYRKPVPEEARLAIDLIAAACRTHFLGLLRAQTEATGEVIAAYETHLMSLKRTMRALAFDDLAHRLAGLFAMVSPGRAGLRLDGALEHVLLDEFQDTSPAQWAVLKPLALAAVDPQGSGSFFCVGDTKQAIYGWRGGVAGIFDAVQEQIPGVQQRNQDESFRSSPVVIDVVNRIFKNLLRHPEFADGGDPDAAPHDRTAYEAAAITHFSTNFPEHSAHKQRLPGHFTFSCTSASEADRREDSETRSARHFGEVAKRIAELAESMPGRSIGVLTRTNRTVGGLIHLLRRGGVDVSQEGGNPLTDSAAVELVLSALMMAEHPADRRWWFHVAHSPLAGWLQTGPQDETHAAAGRVRRLVENLGIAGAVIEIADRLVTVCDEQDRARLRQLVALAERHELNRQPRLRDFVERVRVERIEKPRPAQVRVMTVHQAKGLEFDCVVLPELEGVLTRQARQTIAKKADAGSAPDAMLRYAGADHWHFLPTVWQRAFGGHAAGLMTESLCLLYVALTRARQALHLIVQPADKPDFKNKSASALIYHALGCGARDDLDPTVGGRVWEEVGDAGWSDPGASCQAETESPK